MKPSKWEAIMIVDINDRFWNKVDIKSPDECWLWRATKTSFGYGSFRVGSATDGTRRKEMAHRIAFMLANNIEIPKGKVIMHSCDVPACVNPAHLSIGTHGDNNRDARQKGRVKSTVEGGEKHPRARLTWDIVRYLRNEGRTRSLKELSKQFKVAESTIDAARRGVNWKETK
jgi:hypothetical protein